MRISWWACIAVVVLTGAVAYQHFDRSSLPTEAAGPAEQFEQLPPEPKPSPAEQVVVRPHAPETKPTEHVAVHPLEQEQAPPVTHNDGARLDEARVPDTVSAPAAKQADHAPNVQEQPEPTTSVQKEARLDDATGTVTTAQPEQSGTPPNLSYLAYYAYSELPPEPKPADAVLDALKAIPRGAPVDEIKRVSDVLALDATFMKAVAKVESSFDPKQRTGSYIGLFQLSKKEFEKYGSGDILDARDNAVAASLKFMTETILFETFTHRKPTMNDVYLIHQQGVDGAAEHVSQPSRLAWRSMCATDEGKEKGEKWCKRAIWGNTLPAVKRVWKNVNNLTSGAFVAMWQQRVSEFYTRYSQAAAN